MAPARRPRRRTHRYIWALAGVLAVVGFVMSGTADASKALVTVAPANGVRSGDPITVSINEADPDRHILVALCADIPGVPSTQSCSRWTGAAPTAKGAAKVEMVALTGQVGDDPRAVCPAPDGGRCVLRVVQSGGAALESLAQSILSGDPSGPQPGDDGEVVREVVIDYIEGEEAPGRRRAAPASPLPTMPLESNAGDGSGSPGQTPPPTVLGQTQEAPAPATESAAAPATETSELARTGVGTTLLLAALGLVLLDLGWLALSAVRPPPVPVRVRRAGI